MTGCWSESKRLSPLLALQHACQDNSSKLHNTVRQAVEDIWQTSKRRTTLNWCSPTEGTPAPGKSHNGGIKIQEERHRCKWRHMYLRPVLTTLFNKGITICAVLWKEDNKLWKKRLYWVQLSFYNLKLSFSHHFQLSLRDVSVTNRHGF